MEQVDPFWARARERQLNARPFCAYCAERAILERATVCDVRDGEGVVSLCRSCAGATVAIISKFGFRKDINTAGYPCDPKHPFYVGTAEVRDKK